MEVVKVLVDGRGGVGKTTMLKSLVKGDFDCSTKITIGANFFTKDYTIFDKQVRAQFWDLGGVCRFDFIRSNYYVGANSFVLVGDLTRPTSFEELDFFIKLAKNAGMQAPQIILVGNKTDLFDNRIVDPSYLRIVVEEYNLADLIETSARFRDNLEVVFELATLIGLKSKGFIEEPEFLEYKDYLQNRIQNVLECLTDTQKIIRKCFKCSRSLYFSEFSSTNSELSKERLIELWENTNLEFYCCSCYKKLLDNSNF